MRPHEATAREDCVPRGSHGHVVWDELPLRIGCFQSDQVKGARRGRIASMANRTHLTPEQHWTIISAAPDVPDAALADQLGITLSAVHNARWHFRRHGWSCRIVYATCAWCERPLVRSAKTMKPLVYHSACRPEALKRINQRIDRQRWEATARHEQITILRTLRGHDVIQYEETVTSARSHGRRWTDADDQALIERAGEPAHVLAVALGRTLFAVRTRRHLLRQRGTLTTTADGSPEPPSAPAPDAWRR